MATTDTAADIANDSASVGASSTYSPKTPTSPESPIPTTEATGTSLLALTTPFVQTGSCNNLYSTTYAYATGGSAKGSNGSNVSNGSNGPNAFPSITVYVSDTANPSFTACQPSGWANVAPRLRNSFSPAVCPSDWTAYYIRPETNGDTGKTAVAVATCCTRDHSPVHFPSGISVAGVGVSPCMSTTTGTVMQTDAKNTDTFAVDATTYHVHAPYTVAWQHSDIKHLSPRPPDMTCDQRLPSWSPGPTIPSLECNVEQHPNPALPFLMIGLPIILAVGLFCCGGYIFHKMRARRRLKRTEQPVQIRAEAEEQATKANRDGT
ncbi:hypothetical protein SEUCBS139899_009882 [Sporothrix eucalyptigena]|uniref:Uncharacterized protein n=1 Tax=Sporothrix eucalyptigena TaxID=1812306 RepID=A0ABP0CYY7_9PEZI